MANVKISDLTAAASALGTQEFEVNESGTSKKVTGAQIATYVEGVVSSDPTFTGQVSLADGSNTAPSLTNTGDTNTGIYFPAADTVAFAEGGVERFRLAANGEIGLSGANYGTAGQVLTSGGSGAAVSWADAAAGATGGGSDQIFWENDQTVTTNYTITNGKNAMSAGPITINSGVTVTVGAGETWTVV